MLGLLKSKTFKKKSKSFEVFTDTQTSMLFGIPKSAICVQRFDDSLNSAIHITYRVLLRSSSMREPRDPLLKVLYKFTFLFRHLTEYHIDFIIKLKVD